MILATIIEHASMHADPHQAFLSGNTRDFGPETPAGVELRHANIRLFAKSAAAMGFLAANHS